MTLILSSPAEEVDTTVRPPSPEAITAPRQAPWPPALRRALEDGREIHLSRGQTESLRARLRGCGRLPGLCQERLGGLWEICEARVVEEREICAGEGLAGAVEQRIDASGRWRTWQVVLVAVTAGMLGTTLGYGAAGVLGAAGR